MTIIARRSSRLLAGPCAPPYAHLSQLPQIMVRQSKIWQMASLLNQSAIIPSSRLLRSYAPVGDKLQFVHGSRQASTRVGVEASTTAGLDNGVAT